jgi:hypothetical protein
MTRRRRTRQRCRRVLPGSGGDSRYRSCRGRLPVVRRSHRGCRADSELVSGQPMAEPNVVIGPAQHPSRRCTGSGIAGSSWPGSVGRVPRDARFQPTNQPTDGAVQYGSLTRPHGGRARVWHSGEGLVQAGSRGFPPWALYSHLLPSPDIATGRLVHTGARRNLVFYQPFCSHHLRVCWTPCAARTSPTHHT